MPPEDSQFRGFGFQGEALTILELPAHFAKSFQDIEGAQFFKMGKETGKRLKRRLRPIPG